jgi:hypothetical protein
MVRLTTISWKIGLAVFAAVLPFWQLPAMADDARDEKVETPSPPIEPKTVRVILLPPADEAVFALRPPRSEKAARTIWEQPTDAAAVVPPRPEPAQIQENAALAEPSSFAEPPASAEPPSSLKQPPQIALQPPAGNPASARPRPEPVKIKKAAASAEIPSLPERPPFRPVLYNVQPQEKEQSVASPSREQAREPASFMTKVNSAFRPLASLWPGNRRTSETASPTASPASADAGPASEKTDVVKREPGSFLKVLRFWER